MTAFICIALWVATLLLLARVVVSWLEVSGAGGTRRPIDIRQKELRVSRFGGCRRRDVDEFLDRLTEVGTGLTEGNARLRRQAAAGPVVGSPDLEDVARQADEIIQRAREEAARIDTEARARASTPSSAAPAI